MEYFLIKLPKEHVQRVIPLLSKPKKSSHLIFRLLGPQFQQLYENHPLLLGAPKVFIHGNPHLDNYVRTFNGSGMVDFDRSRIGPYCWDLIRLFSSLSLSSKKYPIHNKVYRYTQKGYLNSFKNPDILHAEPSFLHTLRPKDEHLSTSDYLDAEKKWAKKLQENSIPPDDVDLQQMLHLFLKSRKETKLLKFFYIDQAARCPGSLGKEHILISLMPVAQKKRRDSILLDLKQTYHEHDTDLFYSPTEHQGLRMIRASNLYAPNIEQRLGYFTFQNIHYWGREVPAFNAKIKTSLRKYQLEELGYAIGAQLGRAHRLSIKGKAQALRSHLKENFDQIIDVSLEMNQHVFQLQKKLAQKHL